MAGLLDMLNQIRRPGCGDRHRVAPQTERRLPDSNAIVVGTKYPQQAGPRRPCRGMRSSPNKSGQTQISHHDGFAIVTMTR